MSYLGNSPPSQNFVAGADQFSGTGSQTAFTLSRNVNTVFDIFVTVSNVPQDPFTAYTVSGNTLTFDGAPPSGTNNIDVVYRATNVQTFVPTPGVSPSVGNLNFIGIGNRILGDFSNATVANRVMFQTSTANTNTTVRAIPSGSGANAGWIADNNSDVTNSSFAQFGIVGTTDVRIQSAINGTGTYLPMTFYTGGSERLRVDTSGNVGIGTSSPATILDVNGTITSRAVGGGEGGQLNLLNPDNASTGLTVDVAAADVGRIFSIRNSFSLQIGQLGGTGGTVTFYTANTERMRIASDGVITSGLGGMQVISGTSVSASGTAVNFTGIPSWVKKITVMFSGVSTTGTSIQQIQLGDAGGVETTGYVGTATSNSTGASPVTSNLTTGFGLNSASTAAQTQQGIATICLLNSNTWVFSWVGGRDNAVDLRGAGTKTLSDTLTQVRITTVNGTDQFDAGTINILYE